MCLILAALRLCADTKVLYASTKSGDWVTFGMGQIDACVSFINPAADVGFLQDVGSGSSTLRSSSPKKPSATTNGACRLAQLRPWRLAPSINICPVQRLL